MKLKHLDEYCAARYEAAAYYSSRLNEFDPEQKYIVTPEESVHSTHVYHQYTIKVKDGRRDALKDYLASKDIPSMIYYPLPLQEQDAFKGITKSVGSLATAREAAYSVLSLPVHTEITRDVQDMVIDAIKSYYEGR